MNDVKFVFTSFARVYINDLLDFQML